MKLYRSTRSSLLQLLGVLVLSLSVHAQEAMVNLQFISLPKESNSEPVDLLIGDGKTIKVDLPFNSVSKSYQVPVLASWILGKASVAKGKFKFESYGKVKSISAKTQLIFVLRKSEDDGGGMELIPVDYSEKTFGGGKYYFINMTDIEIEGSIGKSEFSLKPKKHALLAPEPNEVKGSNRYCYTKFFYLKEKVMQPFLSSTWRFNEGARSLVFFYSNPNTKHLKFHTIRSYVK